MLWNRVLVRFLLCYARSEQLRRKNALAEFQRQNTTCYSWTKTWRLHRQRQDLKPLPSTSRILSPSKQEFREANRNWQEVNYSAKVHEVHTQGLEQVFPKTESSLHLRKLNLSAYISRGKDYS